MLAKLNQRTLRKGAVEAAVALATYAVTWVVNHVAELGLGPDEQAVIVLVAQVALQALRRVARDRRAGGTC